MKKQTERIEKLEAVLRRLLNVDFRVPPEMDGAASCFYCDADLECGADHADDCPHIEAKRLLNEKT